MATSVGGALTGRGAELIVIDDPLKPDEALSDAQREAVNEWFDHTLLSRLNDKDRGVIILVMQRLHLDDLVGHVLEQEGWEVVSLPAIAEEPEVHTITTFLPLLSDPREGPAPRGRPLESGRDRNHFQRMTPISTGFADFVELPSGGDRAKNVAVVLKTFRL